MPVYDDFDVSVNATPLYRKHGRTKTVRIYKENARYILFYYDVFSDYSLEDRKK